MSSHILLGIWSLMHVSAYLTVGSYPHNQTRITLSLRENQPVINKENELATTWPPVSIVYSLTEAKWRIYASFN